MSESHRLANYATIRRIKLRRLGFSAVLTSVYRFFSMKVASAGTGAIGGNADSAGDEPKGNL